MGGVRDIWCSHNAPLFACVLITLAEVAYLDPPVGGQQDVVGLDVPVRHAVGMQIREAVQDAQEVVLCKGE